MDGCKEVRSIGPGSNSGRTENSISHPERILLVKAHVLEFRFIFARSSGVLGLHLSSRPQRKHFLIQARARHKFEKEREKSLSRDMATQISP